VGGPFAGGRPSVFQRSQSLLVRWDDAWGCGGGRRGRPPDGACCSRRAGLQQCKSFVEMCIVSCLSASPTCVCGRGAATWGCPCRRLPCCRDSRPALPHQQQARTCNNCYTFSACRLCSRHRLCTKAFTHQGCANARSPSPST
jgi:hypothetical protein